MAGFTFVLGFLLGMAVIFGVYEYWQYQGLIKDKRQD